MVPFIPVMQTFLFLACGLFLNLLYLVAGAAAVKDLFNGIKLHLKYHKWGNCTLRMLLGSLIGCCAYLVQCV